MVAGQAGHPSTGTCESRCFFQTVGVAGGADDSETLRSPTAVITSKGESLGFSCWGVTPTGKGVD